MTTTVIVSPHLDDAVLSLPGFVHDEVRRARRVVVLTVFSEGDARHEARRVEDRSAIAHLGAEAHHLGLLDAPLRRGIEEDFRSLILASLVAGDLDAAWVADAIVHALAQLHARSVLLPLGVGEHVDHRIVHAVHERLGGLVGFYEDRPYALVPHAVRARLARLGARVDGAVVVAPGAAGYRAALERAPYVRAYVPEAEREATLTDLVALAPPTVQGLALRTERRHFAPAARALALRAVQAYVSQLDPLLGSAGLGALQLARATYEERLYWRGECGECGEAG